MAKDASRFNKQVTYSVAVVLRDYNRPDHFLVVKRPADDPDMADAWGLPAVTLKPGELPEEAARRVCREKLNCDAIPGRFLGVMFQKRNSYDIFLMDIEVLLSSDQKPNVKQARTTRTKYTAQKWTTDPLELMASAQAGSCCSSLLLADRGLLSRDEWVASLEGSKLVG